MVANKFRTHSIKLSLPCCLHWSVDSASFAWLHLRLACAPGGDEAGCLEIMQISLTRLEKLFSMYWDVSNHGGLRTRSFFLWNQVSGNPIRSVEKKNTAIAFLEAFGFWDQQGSLPIAWCLPHGGRSGQSFPAAGSSWWATWASDPWVGCEGLEVEIFSPWQDRMDPMARGAFGELVQTIFKQDSYFWK